MTNKKKKIISAIRFWALSQGMEEIIDESYTRFTDKVFKKDDKIYGFIAETDNAQKLKFKSALARNFLQLRVYSY